MPPSILPPDGEPSWSASMLALSNAERDRYAPEHAAPRRPPTPSRLVVGVTD